MQQVDPLEQHRLKTLLHYMKGVEGFSKLLSDLVRSRKQWCPFTHEGISLDIQCYNTNTLVQLVLEYVRKYAICCRYLDCQPYVVKVIEESCHNLSIPERMSSVADFENNLATIKGAVEAIEADIKDKLNHLTCLECERLDEALECLRNYCFYASIVMAVSAVEARITEIIRRHDNSLYESDFAKATLGQLIQLFDENHYTEPKFADLKKLMPAKHKPLIALLNQYRIFSAHPKTERITLQIADAILKLSFTFMIDPETCPYEKKELRCK